jgi:hypothetical protein
MDYKLLIKRLDMPVDFSPPLQLVDDALTATAITRDDLKEDVRGINTSLELIRRTRGGGWPTDPVTEAFNYVDLVWHELEFRERDSFTYVLRDREGGYLGCCYLYPMGRRTPLNDDLLRYDVDVSWWVTPEAYDAGYYAKAYRALRQWLAAEYPFWKVYFSNREIPDG